MHKQSERTDLQAFVYSVAHDFRRPISQIRTIAELLHENLADSIDAEASEMLGWMMTASANALLMMERLLVFNRLITNAPEPIVIGLAALCRDVVERQQAHLDVAGVRLAIDEDLQICADPEVIRLLVAELVDNAVSYGGVDTPVVISARCADGFLRVSVRDAGNGIPAVKMDDALRPFGRLVAEDARHVGMGLNCCLRIAELWGGALIFQQLSSGFEVMLKAPQKGLVISSD